MSTPNPATTKWVPLGDAYPPGMTLIEDKLLVGGGATTFDFQDIPQTFKHLLMEFSAQSSSPDTFFGLNMRLNNNAGSVYDYTRLFSTGTAAFGDAAYSVAQIQMALLPWAALPGCWGVGCIRIPDYRSAHHKHATSTFFSPGADAANPSYSGTMGGRYRSNTAISRVTFLVDGTVQFAAGSRITLYGLN